MRVKELIDELNKWAPPGIAQSYDNVGLQVGDPLQEVNVGLVALEVTPEVIAEAVEMNADVIVTHHPLLFGPVKTLTPSTLVGSMVFSLAKSGISLIASHTNLDAIFDGVSGVLAETLGLKDTEFLAPMQTGLSKLITFVPEEHAERVRDAMSAAGAGRIGNYADVAFESSGVGIFRPLESAKPFVGTTGALERVKELRLEMSVTKDRLRPVVRALLEAHPYETPVYELYTIEETETGFGLGIVGNLEEPVVLTEFMALVCRQINTPALRFAGNPTSMVRRVAVCGGAGKDLISTAQRAGADVYVTSDITYHSYFDVVQPDGAIRMALVDAGHYETEAGAEALIVRWLKDNAPSVSWARTTSRTSPVQTFIANSPR